MRSLRALYLEKLKAHAKALTALFVAGGLLVEGVELSARLGMLIFTALPASPVAKAVGMLAFCFAAYAGVLLALLASGPILLRLWLHTRAYRADIAIVQADFASRRFAHNAVMTGLAGMTGWFRPTIFISQSLIDTCPEAELDAILAHERAHLYRQHLAKRAFLASLIFFGGSLGLAACLTLLAQFGFRGAVTHFGIGAGILPALMAMIGLRRQRDRHELEADRFAIDKFAADPRALHSALDRLTRMNGARTERIVGRRMRALALRMAANSTESGSLVDAA